MTMKVKDDFHHLIDTIEDESLLESYYQLIQTMNSSSGGALWARLTDEQKKELLLAYDESFDENNLISHEQVKLQHEKWLKP